MHTDLGHVSSFGQALVGHTIRLMMADLQPSGHRGSNNRVVSCLQAMRGCWIADVDGNQKQASGQRRQRGKKRHDVFW
jgi:hypothetical protein